MRLTLVLALVAVGSDAFAGARYHVDVHSLSGPGGAPLLSLSPTFELDYRQGGLRVQRRLKLSSWRRQRSARGWRMQARATLADVRVSLLLRGKASSPVIDLELRVSHGRARRVAFERLTFVTDHLDRIDTLDRALRRVVLPRGWSVVGNITPQRVWLRRGTARVALLGGRGVQSLRLRRLSAGRAEIGLELDHHRNHPLPRFRCKRRLPARYLAPGRDDLGLRRAGEVRSLRAQIIVGRSRLAEPMRYPRGYAAAVVLTDHADQSRAATFEALAFGRTGAVAAGELGARYPGLINRGLGYTKTVFVERRGPYARQLDDPRYRALLARVGKRVEIGVHSVTGRADLTKRVRRLLSRFRALGFRGRTWIDHQPDTNCEAISTRGWDRRGRFYALAALARQRFHYLWGTFDHLLARGSLNLLHPAAHRRRRPVIWQHGLIRVDGAPPFVLFASASIFWRRPRLLARTKAASVAALVRERGLLVAHVYLDTHRSRGRMRGRNLVDRIGRGRYRLSPAVDALFVRLARRQKRGELLVGGVERVLGHLAALRQLRLRHERRRLVLDGRALARPLSALTMRLPRGAVAARVEGAARALPGRTRGGQREVWLDLRRGQRLNIELLDASGRPLELLGGDGVALR